MSAVIHNADSELVFTVSEAISRLNKTLEKNFPFIWIRGEVTGFSLSSSGHMYFSIKDELSQLKCIWFADRQNKASKGFDPLTGEVHLKPKPNPASFMRDGLDILCAGRLTYYARGGVIQLGIDHAEPVGIGLLAQTYEDLKLKLFNLGYFRKERKRPLPTNPGRIALITSLQGAAIHDFMRVSQAYGTGARIRLYPTPVQGPEAADKIARAIKLANFHAWADLVVIIRGGGSAEDRWAYNEEALVNAVYDSRLPVLTGIGHEIDISLADLTADASAATPTHAAQIIWPSHTDLRQKLNSASRRLQHAAHMLIHRLGASISHQEKLLSALSPTVKLRNQRASYDLFLKRLKRAIRNLIENKNYSLRKLDTGLMQASPASKLASLQKEIQWQQRKLSNSIRDLVSARKNKFIGSEKNLSRSGSRFFEAQAATLRQLEFKLAQLDPQLPLKRGYALVYSPRKDILDHVSNCALGETLTVQLMDGTLEAVVARIEKQAPGLEKCEEK